MINNHIHDQDVDVLIKEKEPKLKKPPMYKVLLMNDDYTPMDFVVEILIRFFFMDENRAAQIMLQVHNQGKGLCGIYSRDVAETKVAQVNNYARSCDYPLLCIMEAE